MILESLRRWSGKSLANSFSLQVASIVVISVFTVAGISLAILYWSEQKALDLALQYDRHVAARKFEEPLQVVEDALVKLSTSSLIMTALLDSSGRAIYVQPYLQHYSFPISARNGIALCDINGLRLAGTQVMSECNADSPQFRNVIADGRIRRAVHRDGKGKRIWTIYSGVTFAYTGTTEGVAVAQIDLEDVLRSLETSLDAEKIVLQVSNGNGVSSGDKSSSFSIATESATVPVFHGKHLQDSDQLELVMSAGSSKIWSMYFPFVVGYFAATIVLLIIILVWGRQSSRRLTTPLIALRDVAQRISLTGDLSIEIPNSGTDEVGQLAKSIEEMINTIRKSNLTRQIAEERFRLIFEQSSEAIFFSWADGRLEIANEAASRLFGYSSDAITSLGRDSFVDTTDPRFKIAIEERKRVGVCRGELRCFRSDGSQFPAEVSSTLFQDSNGEWRTTTLFRDISEREQAEMALRDSQELISTVFDSLEEIVVVIDLGGIVVATNAAWHRFAHIDDSPESLINPVGLNYLEFGEGGFGGDWLQHTVEIKANLRSLLNGAIGRFELEYACNLTTESRWYNMRATRVRGPMGGAVIVHEDISERKKGELKRIEQGNRLAELSRHIIALQEDARRRLARELHDRTSPTLAAIGINMQVVEMAMHEKNWEEVAGRIRDNRALIEETSVNIRDLCAELRPPALDYAGLASALESYFYQFSRRTGVAIRFNHPANTTMLSAELETTLFRITQEALTNIAKHAHAKSVVVILSVDGNDITLEVKDDGQGFALGDLQTCNGLGMINMRELTEFSGGTFVAKSEPGSGTLISVIFQC